MKNKVLYLLLFALIVRLVFVDVYFQYDEHYTNELLANTNFWGGLEHDVHPPLYFLVQKGWNSLLFFNLPDGFTIVFYKLFNVLVSVFSVYVLFRISMLFFSEKVSLLAAGLMSVYPIHVYFSTVYRPYALLFLLALLSTYYLLSKNKGRYAISTLLGCLTGYFYIFVVISQVIYMIKRKEYSYIKWLAFCSLLLSPLILLISVQLKNTPSIMGVANQSFRGNYPGLLSAIVGKVEIFSYQFSTMAFILTLVLSVGILYLAFSKNSIQNDLVLLAFGSFYTHLILALTSGFTGVQTRYIMLLLPLYLIPLAIILERGKQKFLWFIIVLTYTSMIFLNVLYRYGYV